MKWYDVQVEHLIPVWVQRFLDHGRRVGLLTSDGGHGKRIGKPYNDLVSRQRRNNAGRLSKEPDVRKTSRLYNPSAAITAESSVSFSVDGLRGQLVLLLTCEP